LRHFPLALSKRDRLIRCLVMGLYVVVSVFPFYWMLVTAFKSNSDLYEVKNNPLFFNEPPTLAHFDYLFNRTQFGTWMWNSFVIGVLVVAITLVIATPAGYALARLNLKG